MSVATKKRLLSSLLCAILVISSFPSAAFANSPEPSQAGEVASDYELSVSVEESVNATLKVNNNSKNVSSASLIQCVYNAKGALRGSQAETVQITGEGEYEAAFPVSGLSDGDTIKVFAWDSTTFMPLTAQQEYRFDLSFQLGDIDGYISETSDYGEFAAQIHYLDGSGEAMGEGLGTATLKNASVAYEAGKLRFAGEVDYNGSTAEISALGDYYKHLETENPFEFDNKIFAEFGDEGDIHFVKFQLGKYAEGISGDGQYSDSALLDVVLQSKETRQIMQFSLPVGRDAFNNLYLADSTGFADGLEMKLLKLMLVEPNLLDYEEPPLVVERTINVDDMEATSKQTRVYNGWNLWNWLLDAVERAAGTNNSIYWATYIKDTSMFKGTGSSHFFDSGWEPTGYDVAAFVDYYPGASIGRTGTVYNNSVYYVQIMLSDVVTQSEAAAAYNAKWRFSINYKYHRGMMLEYDPNTGKVRKVPGYGGPKINKLEMGIFGLTNNSFFTKQQVAGGFSTPFTLARMAFSAYSVFGRYDFESCLNHISPYITKGKGGITGIDSFEDTYGKQMNKYGNLIRGVTATSDSNYLTKSGDYLYLEGIFDNKGSNIDYTYKYWMYPAWGII